MESLDVSTLKKISGGADPLSAVTTGSTVIGSQVVDTQVGSLQVQGGAPLARIASSGGTSTGGTQVLPRTQSSAGAGHLAMSHHSERSFLRSLIREFVSFS